jgi:zinc protease
MMRRFLFLLVALVIGATAVPAGAIEIKAVTGPKSGVTAWLVEDHTNPIINLALAWRGGGAHDPVGKDGLANFVASMLDEGAGDMDSQTFQSTLEDLVIRLSFHAGIDSFGGSLQTLSENQDTAFDLLRLAITKPRFDEEPAERMRRQILAGIRRDSENPRSIAGRELMHAMFPDHPYRREVEGQLETVPLIKIADMRQFVIDRLARNNLIVGAVGDITPQQLAERLDQVFGALPAQAKPWSLPLAVPAAADRVVVEPKTVPQSVIRWAQAGVLRKDPDFFAVYIMNHILGGGGFESRLMTEVREKRGLAYSAYSGVVTMQYAGLLQGGADTRNESAAQSLDVIRAEWRRMWEGGVTQAELDDAKTFLTGSYALQFTSSGSIANILVTLQLDDLGIDYIDRRAKLIDAVTIDDVRRVARTVLTPDKLTVVVVGMPKDIAAK